MRTTYTVSVDVGGTFTDAFLSDGSRIAKGKARTTATISQSASSLLWPMRPRASASTPTRSLSSRIT